MAGGPQLPLRACELGVFLEIANMGWKVTQYLSLFLCRWLGSQQDPIFVHYEGAAKDGQSKGQR